MTMDNSERIAELQRKLAARKGQAGFSRNCEAIEAEITRLQALDGASA